MESLIVRVGVAGRVIVFGTVSEDDKLGVSDMVPLIDLEVDTDIDSS